MAEGSSSGFRSRFAAHPGSLSAIRVDYDRNITAFDAPSHDTSIGQNRTNIRRFRQGHRLGDQPEWNSATLDEKEAQFPKRPLMHTLSEYQSVKLNYNFRSSTLPDVNKRTVFVPKPNKMQMDQTAFLTAKEKAMVVSRCPATVSSMSAIEMKNYGLPGVEKESGWNNSTQPEQARLNIFKPKDYEDMRAVNKAKGLVDPNTHKSVFQRQDDISQSVRQTKLAKKHFDEEVRQRKEKQKTTTSSSSAAGGGHTAPAFTMSNMDSWYNLDPVETAAEAAGEDGHRLATTFYASQNNANNANPRSAPAGGKKPNSGGGGGGRGDEGDDHHDAKKGHAL